MWEALSLLLDQTSAWSKYEPLTEAELVSAALVFANHGTPGSVAALTSGLRVGGMSKWLDAAASQFQGADGDDIWSKNRENFRYGLALITQGADLRRLGLPSPVADRMVLRPVTASKDGLLTTRYYYVAESLQTVLAYVLSLVAESVRPYRSKLRQCKLPTCGAFFMVEPNPKGTGAPRRQYCSEDHMKEANAAQVAERVRRFRAKDPKKSKSSARTKRHK